MTCSFAECYHTAHWNPVLVLHLDPRFRGPDYAPSYARTSVGVCDFHRTQVTPEEFVVEGQWAEVVRAFERAGRRRPSRAHLALAFDPIPERVRVIDVRKPFEPLSR